MINFLGEKVIFEKFFFFFKICLPLKKPQKKKKYQAALAAWHETSGQFLFLFFPFIGDMFYLRFMICIFDFFHLVFF